MAFKHTYCRQPRPGRSHMVCSHPCHWTDPNAVAAVETSQNILSHMLPTRVDKCKI